MLFNFKTGLGGTDLQEKPTDLHLSKLALQLFFREDVYSLVIRLVLTVEELERTRLDRGDNSLNFAFLCLRQWKQKTDGTVGDIIDALKDSCVNLNVHIACHVCFMIFMLLT